MRKNESFLSKIMLLIVMMLIAISVVFSISSNKKSEDIESFNKSVEQYKEKLSKYAFGDYEKEYNSILDEIKEVNRKKDISNIDKIEAKLKDLLNKVDQVAQNEVGNFYNELISIDISKLDEANKAETNKIIKEIGTLINKGYYRIAYNEINILKNKVTAKVDEIQKIEKEQEEAKKKQEEEEKKKAEEEAAKNNYQQNYYENNSNEQETTNEENVINQENVIKEESENQQVNESEETEIIDENESINTDGSES